MCFEIQKFRKDRKVVVGLYCVSYDNQWGLSKEPSLTHAHAPRRRRKRKSGGVGQEEEEDEDSEREIKTLDFKALGISELQKEDCDL